MRLRSFLSALPRHLWLVGALIGSCSLVHAQASKSLGIVDSEKHRFEIVQLADGLSFPWGLAFLPHQDLLVTERAGRLRLIKDGKLLPTPISGLPPVVASGQGGVLDVALHPDFMQNQLVYLTYTAAGGGGIGVEVARGKLVHEHLENVEVLFRAAPKLKRERQFGSRLLFAPDGYLYVTLGDRQDAPQAQRLDSHLGSIIRLRDDGTVPEDNPFVGIAQAKPELFSTGHRNPQGLALQASTGRIWSVEHGPQGGDELNIIRKGLNYGWPIISHGRSYGDGAQIGEGTEKPGMEQPVKYWTPSIAPSGLLFYEGDAFPQWRGSVFIGSLSLHFLQRLELQGDTVVHEEQLLSLLLGRIRDVRVGPDGLIYLVTDAVNGQVVRLQPVDKLIQVKHRSASIHEYLQR